MQKIHDNIYVHNTTGGFNVGCVVDKEGAISIDLPLLVDEALQWRGEIQQLTPKPLRMVLFTSVDRVNSEAMKALAPNLGAFGLPALIHDVGFSQLYAALEASQPRMLEPLSPVQLRERAVLPDLTYSEATTFTLGSENPIYLDITSANTFMPGSSVVTVRDTGIIFTGWLVAGNEPPALQKGNIDAWLAALAVIRRSRKLKAVVPASGPVGDMALVARTQEYLKDAQAGVRKLARSRKPRENLVQLAGELLATFAPVPSDNDAFMRNAVTGLERLYDDLVAQALISDAVHE